MTLKSRDIFFSCGKRGIHELALLCLVLFLVTTTLSFADTTHVWSGNEIGREWTPAGSPYIIHDEIDIDEELIIFPGVEVLVAQNSYINVQGLLIADGENADDRITFRQFNGGLWHGIRFIDSNPACVLNFCQIEDVFDGISLQSSSPVISNSFIHSEYIAINSRENSSPLIVNNDIIVDQHPTISRCMGINLLYGSDAHITGNRISVQGSQNGEITGINIIQSQPRIVNNWLNIEPSGIAYGIFARESIRLNVIGNVIRVHGYQSMQAFLSLNSTNVNLINNTIHLTGSSSSAFGIVARGDSECLVVNNLILGNAGNTGIYSEVETIIPGSGWNGYYRNGINNSGFWDGHEDDVEDVYPIYLATNIASAFEREDYAPTWDDYREGREELKSPLIDAGDPNRFDDDDLDSRSDIGALYYFQEEINSVPFEKDSRIIDFEIDGAYPNPFNNVVNVRLKLKNNADVTLEVLDINGRLIDQTSKQLDSGSHTLSWQPKSGIGAGEYFLRIDSGKSSQTLKTLYLP